MIADVTPCLQRHRAAFQKHTPGGVLLKADRENLIRATMRDTRADRAVVVAALESEEAKK